MASLLRKPTPLAQTSGVTLVHSVTTENSPLEYVQFKVINLAPTATYSEFLTDWECCVVAVQGKINVTVSTDRFTAAETFQNLGTRDSVFSQQPTDSVYVSRAKHITLAGATSARVALCYAPSLEARPTKLIRAADNTIEHRGILNNQRRVHNILPDSNPCADSLLVVEVFTEAGNWSSYPPHKHDQDNLPQESMLEETYYHELNPSQGFVFQRVYTDDLSIDETMAVMNGDVVIVPKGYHPVGVPDGYTSYYLNVMAGPKRIWKFYNDPAHEWILNRQS